MTESLFVLLLAICAVITAFLTQGVKKIYTLKKKDYASNGIVLVVAAIVGLSVAAVAYLQLDIPFSSLNIIMMFALTIGNWLGAMLGYDKVTQLITQINQIIGK